MGMGEMKGALAVRRQANFPRTVGWFVSPSGHRWQTSFCLNGFARRAGERVWGHKSVQLPPAPDDGRIQKRVRSFAIPGLIQTCCTLGRLPPLRLVLVVRFLSIVGGMGEGRTLPNYYSRLWQKGSTRSYDSLLPFAGET